MPNHDWYEYWYFAEYGNIGTEFTSGGNTYAASQTGVPSPDAIVARGPVHGCDNGSYEFQTPLGAIGITGDDPVVAGAGSFVADFSDEGDIEWLDTAGAPIEKPEPPGPDLKPPKLPPEFFEQPPDVKGCFRDFEGKLHCPEGADTAAMAPGANFIAPGSGAPPPGIAMLVASGSGIIPQVKAIVPPVGNVNTSPLGSKVEVTCPAELVLTATFYKDHTFDPGTVQYRFRFAHGPVSTVFSTLVDKDGANSVFHSVPIPLPPPIGQTPGGGGVTPFPGTLAVFVKPKDPIGPGGPPVLSDVYALEALPDNEHKSSVRVEVINAFEGVVSSNWVTYHLVCTEASTRPTLRPGLRGAGVTALQAGLNRWLLSQQMTSLKIDGIFGPRTEAAVSAFQRARRLVVDGIVAPKTWKQLLSL